MTDYSIPEILQKWELGLIPKDSRVILLIPRKEEEGCPPDRAYCGTDDSSGKKCQYFDDCKQPKEEAKLTCDKSKEPPCHLEPSTELCKKCLLDTKENTTP